MCRVIVRQNDAILLVLSKKYGQWDLPGGKRKPGEKKLACAKRELEEETGLYWILGRELNNKVFECELFSGCPKIMEPDKQNAIGWFTSLPDNLTDRTREILVEIL